jgi:hypothetical protein
MQFHGWKFSASLVFLSIHPSTILSEQSSFCNSVDWCLQSLRRNGANEVYYAAVNEQLNQSPVSKSPAWGWDPSTRSSSLRLSMAHLVHWDLGESLSESLRRYAMSCYLSESISHQEYRKWQNWALLRCRSILSVPNLQERLLFYFQRRNWGPDGDKGVSCITCAREYIRVRKVDRIVL